MPYQVVKDFEKAVAKYTGAPYCVTTNSCTMALFLCLKYVLGRNYLLGQLRTWTYKIEIPKRTYVSVPMSILHAGERVVFRDESWHGSYQLKPYPIFDSARRFTAGMYRHGTFACVSFHASKILGDTQGGAIIHDDPIADTWFRRARFDGRQEGLHPSRDDFTMLGWHCYMSSDVAARLLLKLYSLPRDNPDLPNDNYPDLSTMEIFK